MARKPSSMGQLFGLGLSFGVTMFVSIWICTAVGGWIDSKLGLTGFFEFIGVILGVFSGFRLLMENVAALDRKQGHQDDDDE